MPRARSKRVAWAHITPDVRISERPAEAEGRAIPGHWEGDLIIGTDRSAIGTVVERTTGYTTLVYPPREEGWPEQPIVKNGTSLSGYGSLSTNEALAAAMSTLPDRLKRSLTWGRGKEMSFRAQFTIDTGLKCISLIRTAPGGVAQTRPPTGCYADTSRRAPTCPARTPKTSQPSPTYSTPDPGNDSAGKPPDRSARFWDDGRVRRGN